MAQKKTWIEKRESGVEPKVKVCENGFADIQPGQMMLLPSSAQIDRYIRAIPKGESRDLSTIRHELAQDSGAEMSCPVVTGICLRIVAEAAYEDMQKGAGLSDITPLWRAIGPKTKTLKKLSFDPAFILEQREREGITALT